MNGVLLDRGLADTQIDNAVIEAVVISIYGMTVLFNRMPSIGYGSLYGGRVCKTGHPLGGC